MANSLHTNSSNILDVFDLEIGYIKNPRKTISKNIEFSIEKPQLVGIVGANGIGKSTLLRTISGMQPSLAGDIFLKGNKLNKLSHLDRAKLMSVVLTEQMVSRNMSVLELVALGRQPYTNWLGTLSPYDLEIIYDAVRSTGLENLKNTSCSELSDGQFQKVMIARALAQETDLIIMDEPTTHLDMYHKAYIIRLLKKLVDKSEKTIIFSSHEIDLAIQLCDKMVVMTTNGVYFDSPCKLIEAGIFEDLFPADLISFDSQSGSFKVKK